MEIEQIHAEMVEVRDKATRTITLDQKCWLFVPTDQFYGWYNAIHTIAPDVAMVLLKTVCGQGEDYVCVDFFLLERVMHIRPLGHPGKHSLFLLEDIGNNCQDGDGHVVISPDDYQLLCESFPYGRLIKRELTDLADGPIPADEHLLVTFEDYARITKVVGAKYFYVAVPG